MPGWQAWRTADAVRTLIRAAPLHLSDQLPPEACRFPLITIYIWLDPSSR